MDADTGAPLSPLSPLLERHGHLLRQPERGAVGRSPHRAPLRLRLRGGGRERDGEARGLLQPLPSLRRQTGICLSPRGRRQPASLDLRPKTRRAAGASGGGGVWAPGRTLTGAAPERSEPARRPSE